MMNKRLLELGNGSVIDFKTVRNISGEFGDTPDRRFTVYFIGGDRIEIFTSDISKEKFVERWGNALSNREEDLLLG